MKGCGEAGAIGSPPALINAITDAIGNNDLTMPATPQKVCKVMHGLRDGNQMSGQRHTSEANQGRPAVAARAARPRRACVNDAIRPVSETT